jgi:hypothetical protein
MLGRALRALLFATVVLAVWAVARPASAMPAAFCDDRGASAIAPPPTFEAPDVAVQRARMSSACEGQDVPFHATISPAHRGIAPPVFAGDPALPVSVANIAPLAGEDLAPTVDVDRSLAGVRSRVERPPRG